MLAVIGLHYGVCPDGLPGGFYKIAPHQSMGAHCNACALLVVPTLVDSGCQTNISSQVFYAVKTPEISKLADNAAGYDPAYSRNTF